MDNRDQVREFLTSRRAKITPEQAGLIAGSRRRVPGLHLAQTADGSDVLARPRRRSARPQTLHRSLQWTLDAITAGPAFVQNSRMDVLAANRFARAFFADLYASPANQENLARFAFLDPASRRFYPDWGPFADMCVAMLRTEAGRNPHDKELHDLVGELSTRSDEFRTRWGTHNVRRHGTGTKRFHHAIVGKLTLAFEGLQMIADPSLTITIYTAEPGSPSEEGLRLLASWAATQEARTPTEPLAAD